MARPKMARTPWHPAGFQAIEKELDDWRKDLTIEAEYQLTSEPLRIDVLVIKKKRDIAIKKNIAEIFRQCNIIEYKSPDDSVTVASYDKTHGYARLYASLNNVRIDDLSVTVVTTRYPRKLLEFLRSRFDVRQEHQGIYIVEGEVYPTQIIVTAELLRENNFWLANLRNDLTAEQLARTLTIAVDKSGTDAYIHAITNANRKKLEELQMKKEVIYTEKLDAFFRERYASDFAKDFAKDLAKGKAECKAESVLTVLRARFNKIPKEIERSIRNISDPIALDSWTAQAATCQSMKEFAEALK